MSIIEQNRYKNNSFSGISDGLKQLLKSNKPKEFVIEANPKKESLRSLLGKEERKRESILELLRDDDEYPATDIEIVEVTAFDAKEEKDYSTHPSVIISSPIETNIPKFHLKKESKIKQAIKLKKIKSPKISFPKIRIARGKNIIRPSINLPKISINLPSFSFKDKSRDMVGRISAKAGYHYDVTMNMLSCYQLRHESVLGIDITPSCIYVCQIDGLNGKRVLTSLTSVCMEGKFMSEDISNNIDEYADSLKSLIKANNIDTKNVALSIPVSSSIVRTMTIPLMDDNEIGKALKSGSLWNNFMKTDKNPDDYSVFYQVISRDKSRDTMQILVVATKLSDISLYTDIIRKSGLNPVIVDVRCFAISNAFKHKMSTLDNIGPSVFLEFGFEESYALFINNDEASIYEINMTDAERTAIISNTLNEEVINRFTERYANELSKVIRLYEKNHGISEKDDKQIKNIFILSDVPLIHTIVNKISSQMDRYNISECNFFDCMNVSNDFTVSKESAGLNLSSWSAAIGTALRKIDIFGETPKHKCSTNLVPFGHRYVWEQRAKYMLNTIATAASVAVAVFIGATYASVNIEGRYLSSLAAGLSGVESVYNAKESRYNQLQTASDEAAHVESLIKEVEYSQYSLLSAYQYLNLIILEDVWLKEINFTAPDNLEISGGSTHDHSIVEFLSLLEEGSSFKKVALREMQEIREDSMYRNGSVAVKSFKLQGTLPSMEENRNNVNMMAGGLRSGS